MDTIDVSVIVATRNDESNIKNCLESIKNQDYPGDKIEIIVVDNSSGDITKEIARIYTPHVYDHGPERPAQRNFGAKRARGAYLLYLDADMALSKGVIQECVRRCEKGGYAALYIPERIRGEGFLIKVRDFERSFYDATCIDAVRFMKMDAFLKAGRFDETLTGPEDWDLDRRMWSVGKVGIIDAPLYHNERKVTLEHYLHNRTYYAGSFDRYTKKWGKRDPVIRRQLGWRYRLFGVFFENGKWNRLLAHPLLAAGIYWLRFTVGCGYIIARRKYRALTRKKGVVIITPFFRPNVGGVETRFDDICAQLDTRGYRVTVLTYQPLITAKARGLPIERDGNVTIYRYWWIGLDLFHKLKPYPLLQMFYLCPILFLRSALYLIRNFGVVDVIHTAGFSASLMGRLIKIFFGKRWVASTHAMYDLKKDTRLALIIRWILNGADAVLTLSEPSRRELMAIGVRQEKLINQITWVDQYIFRPMDRGLCRKRIERKDNFTVLFVGRLLEIKGVRDLIAVAEDTPHIDFVFIGDGPLAPLLNQKSKQSYNISFLSKLENKALPVYYNAADVFIMPSQYKEGLGSVIVEALSCGTPVICTSLGGMAEILDDSVAVLIEPTKENMRSAIVDLYNNREKLTRMRKNARSFAQRAFSPRNVEVIISAYGFGKK